MVFSRLFPALLVLGFTAFSPAARSQEVVGTVASLDGSAQLGSEGAWRAVAISSPVFLGDTLRTGSPGRVRIVFRDDSVLNVGDGSELVVDEQVVDPTRGKYQSTFSLLRGRLRALVSEYYQSPDSEYEVDTPTAVAGVRGTEFVVEFDEVRQQTEVVGVSGRVVVGSLRGVGEEVFITAQEMTTVARDGVPSTPRRIEEDRFRQYLEGLEFIGHGSSESLTASHPIVGGAALPAADRAPLWNAGTLDGRGERDASTLLEQPPELIERLEGGLSIRF